MTNGIDIVFLLCSWPPVQKHIQYNIIGLIAVRGYRRNLTMAFNKVIGSLVIEIDWLIGRLCSGPCDKFNSIGKLFCVYSVFRHVMFCENVIFPFDMWNSVFILIRPLVFCGSTITCFLFYVTSHSKTKKQNFKFINKK